MPPTKSERRLHETIHRLRSELATSNATVAYLRKRLREAAIVVEPAGASRAEAFVDPLYRDVLQAFGMETALALTSDPADCDDDPAAHADDCGRCALCPGFGDCDDNEKHGG